MTDAEIIANARAIMRSPLTQPGELARVGQAICDLCEKLSEQNAEFAEMLEKTHELVVQQAARIALLEKVREAADLVRTCGQGVGFLNLHKALNACEEK